jgi:hypothetical protein
MVFPARDADEVTHCSKGALKSDFFTGQLLVDSLGAVLKITGAKKLRGVGPFWGYNIFLNQRIEVQLISDSPPGRLDLDSIRERVLIAFCSKQGWNASADLRELAESITRAQSIKEITNAVTDAYYWKYPVR